jgi:biotin synthase-like enzyme
MFASILLNNFQKKGVDMQNENLKSWHKPLFANVISNMSFDPRCTHLNLAQA